MAEEFIQIANPDFKAGLVQVHLDLSRRLQQNSLLESQESANNSVLADIFRRYWQNETTPPVNGKVNVAIRVATADGEVSTYSAKPEDLQNVDRSAPQWKGSNMNGGTGEAWVIVTKISEDGTSTSTESKVSPCKYQTKNGETAYALQLDELKTDKNLSRGAMFRNKQILFS